ncbi:MAG: hypothetical protein A2268_12725 [Candidatus Raymondbacteria bacterium RifOxyA12_full_50_37]|uniref:Response regulatory domain-containing protein n=1 Tax=Candidatus Raymondbacteria bacterium RIFOXYD12_FULL_49_13 TaxID=1817890 RepID=A0A1F7FIJ7_UNCRA|nr:MAG: hypothetical protein A2268_12725 [Candidatus Raymondbacteria bacterium RifOxyA12_full_50_37]OGJ90799.1 MAG: hypothetical protein A2248_02265 [Candidatus Raymondbacteria bacterium RIFOXYA2_FULL_49_16]OGJ96332.1 MAG: hypothetical protein A2350_03745 [Candidatus Raymondbacteria bacterium RifOxyB12_full_50_8]OGJ97366.1 MAG: hypothetical protein A2453_03545 [Candidatus Raymondbacteria bacterium RIFOXYC2_FULL_50_21]OGK06471.1 MAG: hypothetical protein A2487_21350 [Candidatus Raymondbacteria b
MRPKLMIVEENPRITKLLCAKFQGKGFETTACVNGQDAWEALGKETFHFVISEALLPGMGGFELLEKIRSSPSLARLPFIFLTTVSTEEDIVKGLEIGANDYLTKPFSFAELHARMKKWLST